MSFLGISNNTQPVHNDAAIHDQSGNMIPETKQWFEQETMAMKDQVKSMSDSMSVNEAKFF